MTAVAPLQIVELRAENVKKLVAVTIRPDEHGNLVVLSGKNGAGKTSVLDAIAMALGGGDQIPAEPIRRGADHAEVVVDLGDLIVRRTFTPSGGGTLVVANREGARFQSPQTMLDKLVGKLTFDPLAFSRMKATEQGDVLRRLLGLDLTQHDKDRQAIFDNRTAVNRDAKAIGARLDAMPQHDVPDDPVDVAGLLRQLGELNNEERQRADVQDAINRAREQQRAYRNEITDLESRLSKAKALLETSQNATHVWQRQLDAMQPLNKEPVLEQIRNAETINGKIKSNHERQRLAATHAELEATAARWTAAIEAKDAERRQRIAACAMPVPGLGFSPSGAVTLNDLPLEQASVAERLRVSVAIGLAMNPRLRVLLIRDASLLDSDSMRMVAELAQKAGAQLWVERVEVDSSTTVVIEDGQVADAAPAAAQAHTA